ncbi:hypothetical protein XA68_16081 [Ophiocordyceps unilateralis]|uniref:Uncharacterized protein n=1 Tax=Ophiocordyceps unilateralis TaxID=268505 RepID=A0A2A9PLU2_OPHUN|nr:hypothetical protein XA68_16081 [Ophiocordyceps unilateralis]
MIRQTRESDFGCGVAIVSYRPKKEGSFLPPPNPPPSGPFSPPLGAKREDEDETKGKGSGWEQHGWVLDRTLSRRPS